MGLQAQENKLTGLPGYRAWPASLETLFVQDNSADDSFLLPIELASCANLKRVNFSKLKLDGASQIVSEKIRARCLSDADGMYWGTDGVVQSL